MNSRLLGTGSIDASPPVSSRTNPILGSRPSRLPRHNGIFTRLFGAIRISRILPIRERATSANGQYVVQQSLVGSHNTRALLHWSRRATIAVKRREFLAATAGAVAASSCGGPHPGAADATAGSGDTVIDFHQHTNYKGRTDEDLVAHQRKMGVDLTVLLPSGSRFGLAADALGNDSVVSLAERFPEEFVYFANELPDIPETRQVLEKFLNLGAIGIGEQKFPVECDSQAMQLVYSIAREFDVPVLIHFQHERYNMGIARFHAMLERFPSVNFIGHAQTWWGNIDAKHDQAVMYPETPVTPGGITDKLLSNYGNMYGDLSAGSGLNSMLRDAEHATGFLERHQDRLLWASDCNDTFGRGVDCIGSKSQAAVKRLAPNDVVTAKILSGNAAHLLERT